MSDVEAAGVDNLTASMEKLSQRMHKGYFSKHEPKVDCGFEKMDLSSAEFKKGSKRPMLTQAEKLEIIHSAVIKLMKYKDIAKQFRVTVATVGMLVSKARKKPKFMDELFAKQDLRQLKTSRVQQVVNDMTSNDAFIDSCKCVVAKTNETFEDSNSDTSVPAYSLTVTAAETRSIMKGMGLKFKKVHHIAMTANS
jgi:hypothetical protein